MKRRDFLRHLDFTGCVLEREGGKHSIYLNPANQKTSAVPRHKEIYPPLPKKICQDLGVQPPQGK